MHRAFQRGPYAPGLRGTAVFAALLVVATACSNASPTTRVLGIRATPSPTPALDGSPVPGETLAPGTTPTPTPRKQKVTGPTPTPPPGATPRPKNVKVGIHAPRTGFGQI